MTTRTGILACLAALITAGAAPATAGSAAGIPARPEEIAFRPLDFQPPRAQDYRRTLSNGVPVYMMPSSEFPLVTINFSFKPGQHLEEKTGLAAMTDAMIRRGGTLSKSAQDLDEEFDYLAANATSSTLNCLTSNLDEAFALFMDMLRNPGFQDDRVKVYKDDLLEQMKQRNDDPDTILQMTGARLVWGDRHHEGRQATRADIESIGIDDMRRFHTRIYHPGNLIIGVTGDFDPGAMLARLESAMSGWAKGDPVPDPADTDHTFAPGLYYVQKDIPQGKIWIAQRGITRDDPDAIALSVMNDILGGGGFTSRLMKRIRSDEGLTYGVSSRFQSRVYYPGLFTVGTFSKNTTVALTAKMVFEELDRIRREPVSDEELDVSKKSFIETFPRQFESKAGTVATFINDEWTGRPEDHWRTYRDRVNAVTASEVQRVAQRYLTPENMLMLVVGDWGPISRGDPGEQRVSHKADMSIFFGGAPAMRLPLLDPLTQQPLPFEDAATH